MEMAGGLLLTNLVQRRARSASAPIPVTLQSPNLRSVLLRPRYALSPKHQKLRAAATTSAAWQSEAGTAQADGALPLDGEQDKEDPDWDWWVFWGGDDWEEVPDSFKVHCLKDDHPTHPRAGIFS